MAEPEFLISAKALSGCPASIDREVAFIGRSNVGKSSVLGAVLGRQSLVKRSRTPGRTQLMNYFRMRSGEVLVDLPGYGFAKVPPALKAELDQMIGDYIDHRASLAALFLVVDARREALSVEDSYWYARAQRRGLRVDVILNKVDCIAKAKQRPLISTLERDLALPEGAILGCSAKMGEGIVTLRNRVIGILRDA